ncbi:MAG: hypothetical protein LBR07_07920 [Puniceicoccales bacterium]|jgi:hypothetical protein|nr:hypothetical protein [Puniceicoccales bacterium]
MNTTLAQKSKKHARFKNASLPLLAAASALLAGCGGSVDSGEFTAAVDQDRLNDAFIAATNAGGAGSDTGIVGKENLYWQLNRGGVALATGRADVAVKDLDDPNGNALGATKSFLDFDAESAAKGAAFYAGAMLSNDNALPYTGKAFERVMAVTYAALGLLLRDGLKAAPAFVRIDRWQNDIDVRFLKEKVAREDSLAQARLAEKDPKKRAETEREEREEKREVQKMFENDRDIADVFNQKNYLGFGNPYAYYLCGLVNLWMGNFGDAENYFREVASMEEDCEQVRRDYKLAKTGKAEAVAGRVWVVVENGLAPKLEEFKLSKKKSISVGAGIVPPAAMSLANLSGLNISACLNPIPLTIPYAVTKLKPRPAPEDSYFTVGAGGRFYATETVCNMDRAAITEYKKTYDGMIAREVFRTTARVIGQVAIVVGARIGAEALKKKAGSIPFAGALLSGPGVEIAAIAAAQALMDSLAAADTRQWYALPKNIQVVSVKIPADRTITIGGKTGRQSVQIPNHARNAFVWFRVPHTVATAPAPQVVAIE